jgi:hypothetical protein
VEEEVGADGRRHSQRPVSIAAAFLIFGIPAWRDSGALLWRRRRIASGMLRAVIGIVVWLTGWIAFKGMV